MEYLLTIMMEWQVLDLPYYPKQSENQVKYKEQGFSDFGQEAV